MKLGAAKTIVVTGANAGLGFQLALALARTGAYVVMACRNAERAELARRRLLDEAPEAQVTTLPLDGDYSPWRVYARSKVALLTYTLELDRRLRERGSHIIALAAHPGFALTEMAKNPVTQPRTAVGRWLQRRVEPWIPSAAAAAAPILHAVRADGVSGGEYFGPGGWLEITGAPAKARLHACALDEDLGKRLWSKSEALTGVHYLPASKAVS